MKLTLTFQLLSVVFIRIPLPSARQKTWQVRCPRIPVSVSPCFGSPLGLSLDPRDNPNGDEAQIRAPRCPISMFLIGYFYFVFVCPLLGKYLVVVISTSLLSFSSPHLNIHSHYSLHYKSVFTNSLQDICRNVVTEPVYSENR